MSITRSIRAQRLACWVAACAALGLPTLASAQVPSYLPLQGVLSDAGGQPIDGEREVVFSLYTALSGGEALYQEPQTLLIESGAFTAYLGSSTALDMGLFRDHPVLYLGIKVGADEEMTPRIFLGSAPFAGLAQYAGEAASVGGLQPADLAVAGHQHSYSSLTNVPASFPPSAHGHGFDEISDKPSTYPPASHDHAFASLTGIPAGLGDGDDDTVPGMSCDGVLGWTGSAFTCQEDQDTRPAEACGGGMVLTFDGSDFACVIDADTDTDTTYSAAAGGGLSLNGTQFSASGINNSHIASNAAIAASKINRSGLDADLLDGIDSTDLEVFTTTLWVHPQGTATENGTTLINKVAGISDASESKPYVVRLEPGVYDLGSAALEVPAWVSLAGAGAESTTVRSTNGNLDSGGVIRFDRSATPAFTGVHSLRQLTVLNTGGGIRAVGVNVKGTSFFAEDLVIRTSNASQTSLGLRVYNASSGFSQRVVNVVISSDQAPECYGIDCTNCSLTLGASQVTTAASTATSYALFFESNVDADVWTSTITGTASGGAGYAIRTLASSTRVQHSRLSGGSWSIAGASSTLRIAHSQVAGPVDTDLSLTCVGAYDTAFAPLNATCQ